jgi:3-dehydroshikimate dehydratase
LRDSAGERLDLNRDCGFNAAMAFAAGLVTVTFRQLEPRAVVEVARRAGLATLEWGGDVHVPPGDLENARRVRELTREAGLSVTAYGSYFRVGEEDRAAFGKVLETAVELGAPAIRVWPGKRGSANADAAYRARVVEDTLAIAESAKHAGVLVCYEFHEGTLTDTDESAKQLLVATQHPAVRTLWQPPHEVPVEQAKESLSGVLPWLSHVHVFHWPRRGERAALAEGAQRWKAYIDVLRESGKECPLLLEFVRNDDPEQLVRDAATLREWIQDANT